MATVGQRGQVNPSEVRPDGGPFFPAPCGGGAAQVTPSKSHHHSGAGGGGAGPGLHTHWMDGNVEVINSEGESSAAGHREESEVGRLR